MWEIRILSDKEDLSLLPELSRISYYFTELTSQSDSDQFTAAQGPSIQ